MHQANRVSIKEARSDRIHVFDLGNVLPDCTFLVNISMSILSLLRKEQEPSEHIIAQRVLTQTEMRVLLPLLSSPASCPQEVLQASYYCTYDVLHQAIFAESEAAIAQWNALVEEYRQRLSEADRKGTRRSELRGVYNALFSLRQKLEQLGITIRARKDGYYLAVLRT